MFFLLLQEMYRYNLESKNISKLIVCGFFDVLYENIVQKVPQLHGDISLSLQSVPLHVRNI